MRRHRSTSNWKSARARAAAPRRGGSRFSEAGDTLIEVLLALIVLGLASVALLIAFSTSISASAQHRQLATSDILLSAVSQQAISSIDSQLKLFTSCQTLTYYQQHVTIDPSSGIPSGYTVQLTNVQYWNPGPGPGLPSFGATCFTGQPEEITVAVTHNGVSYSNSFVVDYPLAGATTQSGAGAASQLVFTTAPSSSAVTSTPFAQQPVIEVEDSNGNAVTTDLSPVIISIQSGTSGALSGCAGSESAGIVTFTGCQLNQAGTYTLTATDGNLTSTTNPTVTVTGSTTPYLKFTTQPTGGPSGSAMSQEPVIQVWLGGSLDASWPTGTISLTTSGGQWPSGSPCTTVTVTGGVATVPSSCTFAGGTYYDPVSNETLNIPYTMSASGTGLLPATSATFTVNGAGTASQLVFATQPSGVAAASAATAFSTQPVVDIEDAFGNVVTTSNATVTLQLNPNPPFTSSPTNAALSGCSSTTSKGVATFSGCEVSNFGTGFTLQASSSGLPSQSSSSFNITGVAATMQFTTQPAAGASGSTLPTEPVVTIYDSNGYVVTASTTAISLTASGGSLTLCSNLTPYQGVVTVATCNFAGVVGTNYTLTATQGSVMVTSNPISPTVAGVPTQLDFTTQPVGGVAGSLLTTQPVVKVEDSAGNVVLISSATIALATTPLTGTLSSCGELTAVSGVVNVDSCDFGGVLGTQYTMTATSAGLSPDTSSNFSVTAPGPIDQIALTGCSSNIQWNASCTATATALDAWSNVATSYNGGLTFAQVSGSGAVTGLATETAVNGVASDTVTGSVVGTLQINATGASVISNSIPITVVAIPQTVAITSTAPSGAIYSGSNGQSYTVTDTGGASGNPVVLSIDGASTSSCSVTGNLVSYGIGAGTCIIDANQAGNADYLAAPQVQQSFSIAKANQGTLSVTSLSGTYLTSLTLTTSGGSGTGAVTFMVVNGSATGCTMSGSGPYSLTSSSAGTCLVTATKASDANWNATTSAQATVTLAPANQATLVVTSTSGTYLTPLTLTTSGGSGTGAVTYTVVNGTATGCTVNGSGPYTLTSTSAGTCLVTATKAADANYLVTSSAQTTVNIGKATQTIAFTSTAPSGATYSGSNGQSYTPTATGGGSGNAVTFTIDGASTSGCTITAGVVKYGVGVGTCVVDANQAGNGNYNAAGQVQQTFSVAQATQTITFTSTAPAGATYSGSNGQSYTPTATGGGSGNAVTFTIDASSTSGCTITAGVVKYGLAAGTCVIDANQAGNVDYLAAAQVQQTFTVAKATQTITFTSTAPAGATYSGSNGQSYTPTATGGGSGNAVTFTIDAASTSGCTISAGVVKYGLAAGTCIVDANQAGNGNYLAASQVQQTFTVAKATQTIAYTSTAPVGATYSGSNGQSYTPTATGGGSGNAVTFTIDAASTSGCTITGGVVKYGIGIGTCIIDANQAGNGNYLAAAQDQQSFSIGQATQTITFTSTAPASAAYSGSNSQSYTPTATGGGSGNTVTFTIDAASTSGCTITAGVVKYGLALGTCIIDANQAGNVDYLAAAQVQQSFTIGKANQTITFTSTAPGSATYSGSNGQTYTVTATGGGSGNAVTFTIDAASTSGCTISAGVVSYGLAAGTCIIDANQTGNTNYNAAAQVQQSFNVAKATQTITFTSTAPSAAVYSGSNGQSYTPTATGGGSGNTVTFSIDAASTSGCTITGGVVKYGIGVGTCVVDANQAGSGNYLAAAQVQQTFNVGKATPTLSITSLSGPFTGLTLTYSAGSDGGAVTYAIDSGGSASGCAIQGSGPYTLVATSIGTCIVTASIASNSDYFAASSSPTTITLSKANQATLTVTSTSGSFQTPLTLTFSGGSGTGAVTYAAVNGTATGCLVNGSGPYTLTSTAAGTCLVTATKALDTNYNAISSAQTTVTLFGTKYWTGTSSSSTTVTSATFTAPTGEPVLILVTNESSNTNRTCGIPAGSAALTGVTSLLAPATTAWYTANGDFLMCAYYGYGGGVTNGTVTDTFAHATNFASIQVIEITGDNNATFALAQSNSGGSSTAPVWQLTGTPTSTSEFLFGALTNGATEPSWNAINGFFSVGSMPTSSGTTGYVSTVYIGAPSANPITGAISGTAFWGTIGIEVLP